MDDSLLPLGLALKLIASLAVCFAALIGAAYFLKKRLPGLARLGSETAGAPALKVLETRGLAPGTSLHLVEVEGNRLLILQSRERSDVVWSSDASQAFESLAAAEAPEQPAEPAAAPSPEGAEGPLARFFRPTPPSAQPQASPLREAEDPRRRALEFQRERQRRYRERLKHQAAGALAFPMGGARP